MEHLTAFIDDPRVRKARKLLFAAEQDYKKREKEYNEKVMCGCGHPRSEHGKSYSINFTGGMCKKCKCLRFLAKV